MEPEDSPLYGGISISPNYAENFNKAFFLGGAEAEDMDTLSAGVFINYGVFDRIRKESNPKEANQAPTFYTSSTQSERIIPFEEAKPKVWPQVIRSIANEESLFERVPNLTDSQKSRQRSETSRKIIEDPFHQTSSKESSTLSGSDSESFELEGLKTIRKSSKKMSGHHFKKPLPSSSKSLYFKIPHALPTASCIQTLAKKFQLHQKISELKYDPRPKRNRRRLFSISEKDFDLCLFDSTPKMASLR